MITLSGEFLKTDVVTNSQGTKTTLYVKVLDIDSAETYSIRVKNLDRYKNMKRGENVNIPIHVNTFKDRIYYQEA